ncbi:MAG: hypothetical protein AAF684_02970 [Pseudomonadota bacterium]
MPDLVVIDTPRFRDFDAWLDALAALGREVAFTPDAPRPVAAIAPAAGWASRRRDVVALRRVAGEIVDQSGDWPALRPLALRARALLAAEPIAAR